MDEQEWHAVAGPVANVEADLGGEGNEVGRGRVVCHAGKDTRAADGRGVAAMRARSVASQLA